MYIPEIFKIKDKKLIEEFMAEYPFAILTSMHDNKIEVTHLPISRFKDGYLYGHVSMANIHAKIDEQEEVCLIFQGEHAYISPTFYENPLSVPTWNYSAVHVYGRLKYIDDLEVSWKLFQEMVEIYEGKEGWSLPNEISFKNLIQHIRFFKICEKNIEAKFKLSQNRSKKDIAKVIVSLRENNESDIANFMEQNLSDK